MSLQVRGGRLGRSTVVALIVVVALGAAACGSDELGAVPDTTRTRSGAGPVDRTERAAATPPPGLLAVPTPLPPGEPGSLIARAPFAAGDFPFEVEPFQVLFHSRDRAGRDIPVSGVVLVPTGVPAPAGGRPVVAWGHGTVGLVDGCAPSQDAQAGGRLNSPQSYDRVDQLLAAGAIVTASDYPGLGTPGVHPYLDGVGEGRSVLDSIRVARAFGGSSTAVVEGFSQGSQASIFAGQEWTAGYAPDIDLRGVVAIGTPTRFGDAFGALELPVVQSYIAKILAGLVAGHPELDRSAILTPSGQAAYDRFAAQDTPDGGCVSPEFDLDRDLRADPRSSPAWADALTESYPGRRPVAVPVLMVQSEDDEQALAFLADEVCRDLVANAADVRMWRYQGESHVGSVSVSSDDRSTWILDRLAGRPLTDGVDFTGSKRPRVLAECPAADGGSTSTSTTSPTTTTSTPNPAPLTPTAAVPVPAIPSYAG